MKPKEYRKKYPWLSNFTNESAIPMFVNQFKGDLKADFIKTLDANLHTMSIKRFDFLLFEEFKSKYIAIFPAEHLLVDAAQYESIQGLWIEITEEFGRLRETYCKEEVAAARARMEEQRKKEEEIKNRNEQRRRETLEQLDELFRRMFGTNAFDFFAMFAPVSNIPVKSFQYFSIDASSVNRKTIDIVNTKYKQLALKLHPDKGGTDEAFRTLQEHRKRCLEYLNRLTS